MKRIIQPTLILVMTFGLMLSLSACGEKISDEAVANHMEEAVLPEGGAENLSGDIYEDVRDIDASDFSDLLDSFTAASLVLDRTEIYRQADREKIFLIADMMKNARKLDYEPKTYNNNGDLLLVFEAENGTICGVQLDLTDDLYRTAKGFYDYGEPDTQAVKELWTLLGIEQWPDPVYEKYDWFFNANAEASMESDEKPAYAIEVCIHYLSENEQENVMSTITNFDAPKLEILEELPSSGCYMKIADQTGTGPYYQITFTTTADDLIGPIVFLVNQETEIVGLFYRE